jgi:PPOX class probable F420-dependent enzyme
VAPAITIQAVTSTPTTTPPPAQPASPALSGERAPQAIPETHLDLFQKRAFGHLGTLMPNGTPQVTPVWLLLEDGFILLNSAKGEQKDRNIRTRRRVALCVSDPDNPYRYVAIRGPIVEITEQGAVDVMQRMAAKYTGKPPAPLRPGEVRVTYRLRPDHINSQG